ncbi:reverse transcriptase domain-containing protein [Tanacetum coccineum]
MRSLGAIGSTIHSKIKFLTNHGVITMETSREALRECKHLEKVQGSWKEVQWHQREEKMSRIREQVILKSKSNSDRGPSSGPMLLEKTRSKEDAEEVFTLSHERPDQYVTMGATLTTNCKQLLADILRENMEVFARIRSESTAIPRFVMEHQLKMEGLIRKVRHPEWITNSIPIKLANGTWKVQVDYSTHNKACAKDIQIRMAEDDEEKVGFHTEEGVYCFTHMPKELKNSASILQRMMEKILADQRGQNVEIHLEEIVIKSKSELDLVQDVEETLRKLKRVNIKIDPVMSSFGVKEGRFLDHMVTKEGLRADPGRIHAIILSPTPRSPNQIRNLFLQLTAISKFIPNLAELKHPIRKARTRMETTKESSWMNEAKEALRRIERKLGKLQTLSIPKEGDDPMLCLRQRNKTISSVLLVEREGIQIPVSYVSRPPQGMKICYTSTEKRVQALIHTTRSLRTVFRKHKVKVVTDGPMEETLKLSRREGRLGKWATEIRTYDISYVQWKEVEGSVIRKFFGQGEYLAIWKAIGGNTRDLDSFGEETDKTTDLHQHLSRISFSAAGDGVTDYT